jgi:hypothetical protein
MLLGQEEALACLASPPCVLTLGFLIGAAYITAQIYVYASSHSSTTKPSPPPALPIATATLTAAPIPTVTAPPVAATRRHPGQTCEDARLDALEKAKDAVCQAFPGESCRPTRANAKLLPLYPCSVIVARIAAMKACLAARQQVQDECFKNATDAGHAEQIQNFIKGIAWCETLKATNCVPGHPMSGL